MRLCIPTLDDRGREGALSVHFGSAPYFTLVDSETDELQVVPNLHSEHEPGTCDSAGIMQGLGVDVLICRGLGKRAFARLRDVGVRVFVSEGESVSSVLDEYRAGRLQRLTSELACHGGRRHHGGSA